MLKGKKEDIFKFSLTYASLHLTGEKKQGNLNAREKWIILKIRVTLQYLWIVIFWP